MISSLGEATPSALARAVGVGCERLKGIMFGAAPYYKAELGLVTLGLVEVVESPIGAVYRVTVRGRRKARQLAAREVRRVVARRAVREWGAALRVEAPRSELSRADAASTLVFGWSVVTSGG